jgi:hypothetical protein
MLLEKAENVVFMWISFDNPQSFVIRSTYVIHVDVLATKYGRFYVCQHMRNYVYSYCLRFILFSAANIDRSFL